MDSSLFHLRRFGSILAVPLSPCHCPTTSPCSVPSLPNFASSQLAPPFACIFSSTPATGQVLLVCPGRRSRALRAGHSDLLHWVERAGFEVSPVWRFVWRVAVRNFAISYRCRCRAESKSRLASRACYFCDACLPRTHFESCGAPTDRLACRGQCVGALILQSRTCASLAFVTLQLTLTWHDLYRQHVRDCRVAQPSRRDSA